MTLYRYTAISLERTGPTRSRPRHGEAAAASPAELRATLRNAGLQVIDLRPLAGVNALADKAGPALLRDALRIYLRTHRTRARAEFLDGLATLLHAGMPLAEAVHTLAESRSRARPMLLVLHQSLRGGSALHEALAELPGWFEPAEIAMVRAAGAGGDLAPTLRSIAERHHRTSQISSKLLSTLLYPAVVALAGAAVVVFLSTSTLPKLSSLLTDAGVEVPPLTRAVTAAGGWLSSFGLPSAAAAFAAALALPALASRSTGLIHAIDRAAPAVFRRASLARVWRALAELLHSGVPLVEALRLAAPVPGRFLGAPLSIALLDAADRLEGGGTLAGALSNRRWFDAECVRLVEIGENTGELADVMMRLAERAESSAARAVDRAASLLEPAVILVLAGAIGLVVMGAIQPIIRLQEVIR